MVRTRLNAVNAVESPRRLAASRHRRCRPAASSSPGDPSSRCNAQERCLGREAPGEPGLESRQAIRFAVDRLHPSCIERARSSKRVGCGCAPRVAAGGSRLFTSRRKVLDTHFRKPGSISDRDQSSLRIDAIGRRAARRTRSRPHAVGDVAVPGQYCISGGVPGSGRSPCASFEPVDGRRPLRRRPRPAASRCPAMAAWRHAHARRASSWSTVRHGCRVAPASAVGAVRRLRACAQRARGGTRQDAHAYRLDRVHRNPPCDRRLIAG